MSASRNRSPSKPSRAKPRSGKRPPRNTTATDRIPLRVIGSLAEWAFDLAEREVVDWPSARMHVHNTRRYVLERLEGTQRPRALVSDEDLYFTAALLGRILAERFALDYVNTVSMLDRLELPTDEVPVMPRSPSRGSAPITSADVSRASMRSPTARMRAPVSTPPPLRFCDVCGYVHEPGDHVGYRNAAA